METLVQVCSSGTSTDDEGGKLPLIQMFAEYTAKLLVLECVSSNVAHVPPQTRAFWTQTEEL